VHTVTALEGYWDEQHKMYGKTYWEAKPTLVLVPQQSWVELKAWIIEECRLSGQCDGHISNWRRSVESVDKLVEDRK